MSSPLKYFELGGDFTTGNGITLSLTSEGLKEPEILIPDGVKEIGDSMCNEVQTIEKLIIPDTVEIVGERSFFYSKNINFVKLPKSNSIIKRQAFQSTDNLSKVEFHEGLREMGTDVFTGCDELNGDIVLPKTLSIMNANFSWVNGKKPNKIKSITTYAHKFNTSIFTTRKDITYYFKTMFITEDDVDVNALKNTGESTFYFSYEYVRSVFIKKCVTENPNGGLKESQFKMIN